MAGLLYRELILNKKNLLSIAAGELAVSCLLLLAVMTGTDSDVILLLGMAVNLLLFLILGTFTGGIFGGDESKKWAYFIAASPCTGAGQVKAKYLFTLLLYTLLLSWCYVLSAAVGALGGQADMMSAFMMMCAMLLFNAAEFPFLVRFGSRAGGYIKTAVGLLAVLIAFEYILFGDISVLESFDRLMSFVLRLTDTGAITDISLVCLAAFPYVSAGLYCLSCKISCDLYLKGAEGFEQ